jgi:DNA polymerase III epsilon subunit family exonuclease
MSGRSKLDNLDLVFFDVETTGLDPEKEDTICELGAVKLREGSFVDTFQTLINPKREIPFQASLIHKIYDEDVENSPYFEEVVDKLLYFFEDSVICGYNIGFDLGFLNAELKKINYPRIELPALDVLLMARRTFPELGRYNLISIADYLNVEKREFHRALDDALVTAQIFLKIKEILKDKGVKRIEELLTLYGFNNEFFRKFQEPKIALIRESITAQLNVKFNYLSPSNKLHTFIFKPQKLERQENMYVVGINSQSNKEVKLDLSRILSLEII